MGLQDANGRQDRSRRYSSSIPEVYRLGKDAYIYNCSHDNCAANAREMVGDKQGAMQIREHQTWSKRSMAPQAAIPQMYVGIEN